MEDFERVNCGKCGTIVELIDLYHDIICSNCGHVVWKVLAAVDDDRGKIEK